MKHKFYDLGSPIRSRNFKYVVPPEVWQGVATGGLSLLGDLFGIGSNESINQAQIELAQQQMEQQQQLFYDNLKFNHEEARVNREFNAEQAALNRDFQASELQKNIDLYDKYHKPSNQVGEYLSAGLNPAVLAGNLQSAPIFSTPSGSAASGSPATGSGIPSFPYPTLKSSSGIYQDLGNIFGRSVEDMIKVQEYKKENTFNKYYEEILSTGVNFTKEQARTLKAQQDKIAADIDEVHANIKKAEADAKKSLAEVGLIDKQGKILDEDLIAKHIDNAFRNEHWQELMRGLRAQNDISETAARYAVALVRSRIAMNLGAAAASQSQAELNHAEALLKPTEKQVMIETRNYYEKMTEGQITKNMIDSRWGDKRAKADVEGLTFDNNKIMKVAKFMKEVSVPIITTLGAAYIFKGKTFSPSSSSGSNFGKSFLGIK